MDFPDLTSDRLVFNRPQVADIPRIVEYAGDKRVEAGTLTMPHPYKEEHAIFWINKSNQGFKNGTEYLFAIREHQTKNLLGVIGLHINKKHNHAELGYWLGVPHWNKGFITEAIAKMLEFGFLTLGLHKIFAIHFIENPASGKVMIKNGMIKEAEFKEHLIKKGQYVSGIQYRLTIDEYNALRKQ